MCIRDNMFDLIRIFFVSYLYTVAVEKLKRFLVSKG